MEPPTLDTRTFKELLNQITEQAKEFATEWRSRARDDAGMVLAAIYAHYLEILLERLNRVPEKNLLYFLDMMGVGLLPPGAAKAPVVFTLAPTAGVVGSVPKGAQVATVQTETQPAVIFETEQNLNVMAAQLAASYTIEPGRDRYGNSTPVVTGQDNTVFSPFKGDRLIDHILYIGSDPLLLMQRAGKLILTFQLQSALDGTQLQKLLDAVEWKAFKAGRWQALPPPTFASSTNAFTLTFSDFAGADVTALSGPGLATSPGRWIQGRLNQPITNFQIAETLEIKTLTVHVEQMETGIPPDQVHVNTTPVDFTKDFYPLGENPKAGDTFYVASTEALSKVDQEASSQVIIDLTLKGTDAQLRWEYWNGEKWTEFGPNDDSTKQFTENGLIRFTLPGEANLIKSPVFKEKEEFYCLRVSIAKDGYRRVPSIRSFKVTIPTDQEKKVIRPKPGFTSEEPVNVLTPDGTIDPSLIPIDFGSVFFPFGMVPNVGHTFYFALPYDTPKGRDLEADVLLMPQPVVQLEWEYLGRGGWTRLGGSSTQAKKVDPVLYSFNDGTQAFIETGQITFNPPADDFVPFVPGEVNGQTNYWIRARLTSGYYGRPLEFVQVNPADPSKGFKPRPGTGAPNAPVVSAIRLNYTAQSQSPLVLTQNQFFLEDQTDKNKTGGETYKPFEPVEEKEPTFYLGFDQKLPNNAVNLYFVVPPRQFVEKLKTGEIDLDGGEPKLVWQYWNGRDWTELVVADETNNLTESGGVEFLGPTDMAELRKFDPTPRYWIRVRQAQGGADYSPLLSGVFLNAVRVVQATTIQNELLGSSNGRKNQVFRLSKTPVFPGQKILVREPERPSAEEEANIKEEEGEDAVQEKEVDSTKQILVRWHEVKSLNRSGARSRHYTIDRITGEVRFGDGVHGLIPPEGRDNIVCEVYRAGGEAAGNQAADAISQLKSSIPYIAAVTNPIAADGGSDAETVQTVQERGPQTLKHRGRAVTPEDFEWLARQAAGTRVARAKCLPNRNRDLDFDPGWATVIIVPSGTEKKLLPSAELIREVEDDLEARSLATLTSLTPARINVIGPGYVPVEVAVEVKPVDLPQADAVRKAVLEALDKFLHPLTGGPDGHGWAFGRDVYLSELFAAFEELQGVEHVHSLSFKPTVATVPLTFVAARFDSQLPTKAVCYDVGSILTTGDGQLVALLTEPTTLTIQSDKLVAPPSKSVEQDAPVSSAMVVVFREGERVRVGSEADEVKVTVRSISGNTLTVDAFKAQADYPTGTPVVSVDSVAKSALTSAITKGTLVNLLVVRGFTLDEQVTITRSDGTQSLTLTLAGTLGDRLRVPEFYLVYSGAHTVEISQD